MFTEKKNYRYPIIGGLLVLLFGIFIGSWYYYAYRDIDDRIVPFSVSRDLDAAKALMLEEWNWLQDTPPEKYDLDDLFVGGIPAPWEPHRRGQLKTYVVHKDGNLVGFVCVYPMNLYMGRILFLVINAAYRRQGYATRLINFALRALKNNGSKTARILVRNSNVRARALYEKLGFAKAFEVEGFTFLDRDLGDIS